MPNASELVITYLEASRGLMWTEFVPVHTAEAELQRAVDAGDTARADGIRKALEDAQDAQDAQGAPSTSQ